MAKAVQGYVLAGGLSTRMGRDKATTEYQGISLLKRALGLLTKVAPGPRIAGSRVDLTQYAVVVPDLHPGLGPLGGLEAALEDSEVDLNLFLPVDLPLLPESFLKLLLERASITGAVATIPLANGMPQPLVGVYRRSILPLLRQTIERKEYKVMRAVSQAEKLPGGIDFFHVEMLQSNEKLWPYLWFRNVNSPFDLL